jgi:hypothetical protein
MPVNNGLAQARVAADVYAQRAVVRANTALHTARRFRYHLCSSQSLPALFVAVKQTFKHSGTF